jgi:hypothetical protein
MATQDWTVQHSNLVNVFKTGEITKARLAQLEDYLVVLCNVEDSKLPDIKAQNERYALVVRHLLSVRISEDLHRASEWGSWLAIWISVAAILVSAVLSLYRIKHQ